MLCLKSEHLDNVRRLVLSELTRTRTPWEPANRELEDWMKERKSRKQEEAMHESLAISDKKFCYWQEPDHLPKTQTNANETCCICYPVCLNWPQMISNSACLLRRFKPHAHPRPDGKENKSTSLLAASNSELT